MITALDPPGSSHHSRMETNSKEVAQPLLQTPIGLSGHLNQDDPSSTTTKLQVWTETKKLWQIVGPTMMFCIATNSMNIVSQVFAGHLGDLELASIAIANNVVVGFNYGLLLGMASALETLCGQAFGAKNYKMLGIYMQRSWIILFFCCFLLLPLYIYATPLLRFMGQAEDVAKQSGLVAAWLIPLHFSFAFQFPLQRFLQSQLKTVVLIWVALAALVIHVFLCWLLVIKLRLGILGVAIGLDVSWWALVCGLLGYTVFGGCPETWSGLSMQAFSGLFDFLKLSAASGVMLCLENWYYRILVLMTGYFKNAKLAVDALSVCLSINGWEIMFAVSFLAGTGVRVANELGAGNGRAAKFATKVSVVQSTIIGLFFFSVVLIFRGKLALIFSSSSEVVEAVDKLSLLLAASVLLNSIQPVLSGVAVGSGWQAWVAYINIGCYYLTGLPTGIILGGFFNMGIKGVWVGMILGGTALQTIILTIVTVNRDWEREAANAVSHVEKWSIAD